MFVELSDDKVPKLIQEKVFAEASSYLAFYKREDEMDQLTEPTINLEMELYPEVALVFGHLPSELHQRFKNINAGNLKKGSSLI